MAHERRRAALAALCVFAVALAAALFPAGGFGTYPSGVGTGGGPDAPSGDGAVPDQTTESTPPPATTDGSATTTETETTAEPTETTTPETTTDDGGGSGPDGDSDDDSALPVVLVTLLGGLVVALVAGFWTGFLALGASAAGPLPVTVTVGGTPVGSLVGRIPSRTMALVVGLSSSVPRLLDDGATLAREVGSGLSTVVGGLVRGTAGALRIGVAGLGATFAAIPRALAGLGAGASVLSGVGRSLSFPSFGGRDSGGGRSGPRASADPEPEETGPPSVEEAWQIMSDRVYLTNRKAATPGEIARAAIERGYPDEAVRRLTDSFQEVRYGGFPRAERTEAARAALDRLRRHWRDDE